MNSRKILLQAVKSFERQRIVVIGDVMLDRYLWSEVKRISPEAPVPIAKVVDETFVPGGAANTANNIVNLGGKAYLIGEIGHDTFGTKLKAVLRKNKISVTGLIRSSQGKTIVKTRLMCANHQIVRFDKENGEGLNLKTEAAALKYFNSIIGEINLVIFSDYSKGFVTSSLAQKIITACSRRKIKVLVDSKPAGYEKFKNIYLIKPNRSEAEAFSGVKINKHFSNIRDIYKKFHRLCAAENLLITLGADGMVIAKKSKKVRRIQSHTEEVYDISGAGDTVMAGLALGVSAGLNLDDAAHLGSLCAGVVIAKVGTASCSQKELIEKILNEKSNLS